MIDPTQLPILLKAIDFVFEEGHRILEERRQRRKSNETPPAAGDPTAVEEVAVLQVQDKQQVKQDLLSSKVDEILWQNHQEEVNHLVRLLETYSRNYHLAREQYARWGDALVPPIIVSNLNEAENAMVETIKKLETALSKVYQKDIVQVK